MGRGGDAGSRGRRRLTMARRPPHARQLLDGYDRLAQLLRDQQAALQAGADDEVEAIGAAARELGDALAPLAAEVAAGADAAGLVACREAAALVQREGARLREAMVAVRAAAIAGLQQLDGAPGELVDLRA